MNTNGVAIPTIRFTAHARQRLVERFPGQAQEICAVAESEICEGRLRPADGPRWCVEGVVARKLVRIIVAMDSSDRYSIITWYPIW